MKRTVEKEQYFTSPELASQCIEFARGLLDFDSYNHIVEPSAGGGAFFERLPANRRIGLDIEPQHEEIERADFLRWEPPLFAGPILTIGNPPFGQRAAIAVKFLDHACRFSEAVAFILPRSFNKYTFQNRIDPYFHLLGSFNCDEFHSTDGEVVTVKTTFQVWRRQSTKRKQLELRSTHSDFDMLHCHLSRTTPERLAQIREDYPFTVPQVGANFSPRESSSVDRGSHWFIRPNVAGVRERFERMDFSFLKDMNTAHTSLSKRDIVLAYEKVVSDELRPSGQVHA